MVENPTLHIFRSLVANAKKYTRLGKFDKKCDEGFLLGYSTTSRAYRVWNLDSGTLEELMMLNLMKPRLHKKRIRTWKMLVAFNF